MYAASARPVADNRNPAWMIQRRKTVVWKKIPSSACLMSVRSRYVLSPVYRSPWSYSIAARSKPSQYSMSR